MDDEPLTTVWEVREEEVTGYGAGDFVVTSELFETREAAVASCPTGATVNPKVVRRASLATQTRWRGTVAIDRSANGWETARVHTPSRYVVNEQSGEFGKPVIVSKSEFGGFSCNGPSRKEVLARLHEIADPITESAAKAARWAAERAKEDAELKQDYSCPDHGHLGTAWVGSAMPCVPCRRLVDKDGNRFGHYGKMPDGQLSYSTYPSNGYDEGPLPDGQRTTTT